MLWNFIKLYYVATSVFGWSLPLSLCVFVEEYQRMVKRKNSVTSYFLVHFWALFHERNTSQYAWTYKTWPLETKLCAFQWHIFWIYHLTHDNICLNSCLLSKTCFQGIDEMIFFYSTKCIPSITIVVNIRQIQSEHKSGSLSKNTMTFE